jgi:hypothetical protein
MMVADKRATFDGSASFSVTKIFKIRGSIYGVCGNLEHAMQFIAWRRKPGDKPILLDSTFEALELTPKGEILWWGSGLVGVPIEDEFYAIGTGAAYATGALEMGAKPAAAIKIAAKHDPATSPEVQTMSLGSKS